MHRRSRTAYDPGSNVDVIVTSAEAETVWQLTDLLGRSMGSIVKNASHQFTISQEGHAMETRAALSKGRMPRSMPPWPRLKGTPGASSGGSSQGRVPEERIERIISRK